MFQATKPEEGPRAARESKRARGAAPESAWRPDDRAGEGRGEARQPLGATSTFTIMQARVQIRGSIERRAEGQKRRSISMQSRDTNP